VQAVKLMNEQNDLGSENKKSSDASKENPSSIHTLKNKLDINREHRKVTRSAGIISIAVLGSRLLGLIREQIFAAYFGTGFLKDAFTIG
jgi:hypothetical protein